MDKVMFAKLFANNTASILTKKDREWINKNMTKAVSIERSDLLTIKWVGEATVKLLIENWITSWKELKEAWEEKISKIVKNPLSLNALINNIKN